MITEFLVDTQIAACAWRKEDNNKALNAILVSG